MNPAAYLMLFNRPDFRGLNDKYLERGSRFGISPTSGVEAAINGNGLYDAIGGAVTQNYRDLTTQRISRYRYQWQFYNGNHYEQPWEDGERKTVNNLCKLVVDKGTSFFLANGWQVKAEEGNEQVAALLNDTWQLSNRMSLSKRMLDFGGVNGDCFIYVTVDTTDEAGKVLPRDEWTIRLSAFDPKYCFPFFRRSDPTKMDSIMIQFPVTSPDEPTSNILYTVHITPVTISVWHNENQIDEQPNPFGVVNVVHYRNTELANSSFGVGDIDDIIPLNEEYNLTANAIRRTIKYHGEPTTLIYGARASDMERGAKKVWSNLPKPTDAKVENLKLDGDLDAAQAHLKHIEDMIYKVGGIPKIALESSDTYKVSNTSGIAIQMLFQPLVEKVNQKRISFTQMVKDVNYLILVAFEKILGKDILSLADNKNEIYETEVDYTSPLPRDRGAEIDQGTKLVEAGVWSRAEFMRRVADVPDIERLALELAADRTADLVMAYEDQRAVSMIRPNSLAAFLGSVALSEELEPIARKVAELQRKRLSTSLVKKGGKKPKTRVLTAK